MSRVGATSPRRQPDFYLYSSPKQTIIMPPPHYDFLIKVHISTHFLALALTFKRFPASPYWRFWCALSSLAVLFTESIVW
jgi:hypothetical protein